MSVVIGIRTDLRERYAELNREVNKLVATNHGKTYCWVLGNEPWSASVRKAQAAYEKLCEDFRREITTEGIAHIDPQLPKDVQDLRQKITTLRYRIHNTNSLCAMGVGLIITIIMLAPGVIILSLNNQRI